MAGTPSFPNWARAEADSGNAEQEGLWRRRPGAVGKGRRGPNLAWVLGSSQCAGGFVQDSVWCRSHQPWEEAGGGGRKRGEGKAGLEAEGDCVPGKGVIFPGLAEP